MSCQSTSSGMENISKTMLWGKGKTVPSKGGMGLLVNRVPDVEESTSLPTPCCFLLHVGGELNQDKQTCTFKPPVERKDSCKLLLIAVGVSPGGEEGWHRSGSLLSTGNSFLPSSFSDLLGGESQRGGESRGNPARSKPRRQKTASHHCLPETLCPAYGESLPPGPGKLSALASPSKGPGHKWRCLHALGLQPCSMALTTVDSHPNSRFPEANMNKPNSLSNSVTFEPFTTSQRDLVGSWYLACVSGEALLLAMNLMLSTVNHYS